MAASIKRDDVKQAWEETEFPLVCETCLGDNPYVRMTKENHGKKCQICETPFTVFAWQAGTKGRIKRVEICQSCARAKNVCQVCIYDLQYGLPVKVRDRVLREGGGGAGGAASSSSALAVPQSRANRSWYTAQQQRAMEEESHNGGGSSSTAMVSASAQLAHAKLSEMARMEPRYERNLPKLCSFFAAGECTRGVHCPFRHEMPRDRNDPLSQQNTKNRFYGTSDPVANKILGRKRRQDEIQEKRAAAAQGVGGAAGGDAVYEKARATLFLRFKGDAPYPVALTETMIRDEFYSFGEIVSVHVQADRGQAFVEYTAPEAAELAIANTNKKELFGHGRPLLVAWARAPKRGERGDVIVTTTGQREGNRGDGGPSPAPVRPVAPPGATAAAGPKLPPSTKGLITVKLAPEVLAAAAAKRQQSGAAGGGGAGNNKKSRPNQGPYYPSSDPDRLGTKNSNSATTSTS
jgi:pre-mRNA-splicing factor RBM22/SLT11